METKEKYGLDLVILPNHAHTPDGATARYDRLLDLCKIGSTSGWTCKKTAEFGDIYLFWFGKPVCEIAAVGVSHGDVEMSYNDNWDWTDAEKGWFCSYSPLCALEHKLTADDLRNDDCLGQWWKGRPFQGRPKSIKDTNVAERLIETILAKNKRNPALRKMLCGPFHRFSPTAH